ncbi:hypothetical protein PR202_gb29183 [Eleusine coracana subsp. coracana]|uniref:Uncharacterized protein n=1 Tax=Eleusine coracana subsp. coracana TaxID=191504 RepID=A0AAV5G0P8_ELECO|nr:hypothetical protein PR202_gb29183 [Eleusine coracana subsp. coracana]
MNQCTEAAMVKVGARRQETKAAVTKRVLVAAADQVQEAEEQGEVVVVLLAAADQVQDGEEQSEVVEIDAEVEERGWEVGAAAVKEGKLLQSHMRNLGTRRSPSIMREGSAGVCGSG